jgi:hypothetical protein
VDHFSAITTPAPEQFRSTPPTLLEFRVGKLVALAASALAATVRDYANGSSTKAPKLRAANLIVELFELRQLMVGTWDFDAICHEHGRKALAEACGHVNAREQRILDELVNGAMEILQKLVQSQAN